MTVISQVYDSAQRPPPFIGTFRHLWQYRGLLRLLVTRDLTVRYKRSVLGVWWTLLNPLLTTAVFWLVFSNLFNRASEDVPYVIYLVAGILMAGYFAQGIVACGSAIVSSRGILIKVYVPPEVFSFSAAIAAAVNFLVGLVPLVGLMLILGVDIPATAPLAIFVIVAMLMLVTGLGLIIASMAVYFYDVLDLVRVLTQLVTFGAATFYPLDIVPDRFVPFIKANPLFHYIDVFRGLIYEGQLPGTLSSVMVFGSAVVALVLGVWIFSRTWLNLVVRL